MWATPLPLCFLAVLAFSLATGLEPWFQGWQGNRARSSNLLQVALGDSRRMFARHFYVKADSYFHNGYYPTIYDNREGFQQTHLRETTGQDHGAGEHEEESFLGKPLDWIDSLSRNFFPSRHTHLGEACVDPHCQGHAANKEHDDHAGHDEPAGSKPEGLEREILPWLRLSAELDPARSETYVVASYWLRGKLHKVDEAEQFLREGLQANPADCEILFELGRIYYENRKDPTRARNLWELALRSWSRSEAPKAEPNQVVHSAILNNLALLEVSEKNYTRAIDHYQALKQISPRQQSIQEWIDFCRSNSLAQPHPRSSH